MADGFGLYEDDGSVRPLDMDSARGAVRRHFRREDFDGLSLTPTRDMMAILPHGNMRRREVPLDRPLHERFDQPDLSGADEAKRPDVVTSKPRSSMAAIEDPRYRYTDIELPGSVRARRENGFMAAEAERIAQGLEWATQDRLMPGIVKKKLAKQPINGFDVVSAINPLTVPQMAAAHVLNVGSGMAQAGIRSFGRFMDGPMTGPYENAGTGEAHTGLDALDVLAVPGSGPLGSTIARKAQARADAAADAAARSRGEMVSPRAASLSSGVGLPSDKPKLDPLGPDEIVRFVQNWAEGEGLPARTKTSQPPPPELRRHPGDQPTSYVKIDDPLAPPNSPPVEVRAADHPTPLTKPGRRVIETFAGTNQRGEPLNTEPALRAALESTLPTGDGGLRLTEPGSAPAAPSRRLPADPFKIAPDRFGPFHMQHMQHALNPMEQMSRMRSTERGYFGDLKLPDGRVVTVRIDGPGEMPPISYSGAGHPVIDAVGRAASEVRRLIEDAASGQMRLFSNHGGQRERAAARAAATQEPLDHTPFYGTDVGPKGRIGDTAGAIERLGLESGLPGKPTAEGYFNPATAALLQDGVHPKNTVAYYRKQMESRGGRLPPGHWEDATAGLKPDDVIARDELVRRLDSMAPSLEVRRANDGAMQSHHNEGDRLTRVMDEALRELPPDTRNISVIREILNGSMGVNPEPAVRAAMERYVAAYDAVQAHNNSPHSPAATRWNGYITNPKKGQPVDLGDNYTETALGYREKEPRDWAIERGMDDPRASERMARAFDDEGNLPPGIDPEEAAIQIARAVTDRLSGNVMPYSDKTHMGHMGGSKEGPNLEGWIRTQEVDVPRRMSPDDRAAFDAATARHEAAKRHRDDTEADIVAENDRLEPLRQQRDDVIYGGAMALVRRGDISLPEARALIESAPRLSPQELDRLLMVMEAHREATKGLEASPKPERPMGKALLVDEAQDQRRRMLHKHGARPDAAAVEDLRARVDEARAAYMAKLDEAKDKRIRPESSELLDFTRVEHERMANLTAELDAARKGVEPSPYTHSKPAAAGLLARQAVLDASKAGAERVVWPSGNEQAVRFGIGTRVAGLQYDPVEQVLHTLPRNGNAGHYSAVIDDPWSWVTKPSYKIPPNELGAYIGDEMARKLLASPKVKLKIPGDPAKPPRVVSRHSIETPENEVIGGSGMRSFYGHGSDPGLFGGQIQSTLRKLDRNTEPRLEKVDMDAAGFQTRVDKEFPSVPLSDEAKRKAIEIGMSLYSRGDRKAGLVGNLARGSGEPVPGAEYMILGLWEQGYNHKAIAYHTGLDYDVVKREIDAALKDGTIKGGSPIERRMPPREEIIKKMRAGMTLRDIAREAGFEGPELDSFSRRVTTGGTLDGTDVAPQRGGYRHGVRNNQEFIDKVLELRRGGMRQRDIAEKLGVDRERVRVTIINHWPKDEEKPATPAGNRRGPNPEDVPARDAELRDLREEGLSYADVGARLGKSRSAVAGLIRDARARGVKIRSGGVPVGIGARVPALEAQEERGQ